ncbi:hypothetical protein, partial [Streptomyces atratus]|uniref:hypothetical protein n=1 Tax=Streptomyces atratus TaxID=1893 RepID=UPI003648F4A4
MSKAYAKSLDFQRKGFEGHVEVRFSRIGACYLFGEEGVRCQLAGEGRQVAVYRVEPLGCGESLSCLESLKELLDVIVGRLGVKVGQKLEILEVVGNRLGQRLVPV